LKKTLRTEKIASLIKSTLSEIIAREITDPSLGIITITDVDVAPDLNVAKVYYSLIGGKRDLQKRINTITHLNKMLRHRLAEKIVLKYTPKIRMIYDDTPEKAQQLEHIFVKIRNEKK
jgi:ribosome-binding factor A